MNCIMENNKYFTLAWEKIPIVVDMYLIELDGKNRIKNMINRCYYLHKKEEYSFK